MYVMPDDDTGGEDSRESGVELGELDAELEDYDYPASTDELLAAYGDREIVLPSGSETFEQVLDPMADDSFDSADSVRQAIFNMVGSEAVGRQGYSDRGAGSGDATDEEVTDESF